MKTVQNNLRIAILIIAAATLTACAQTHSQSTLWDSADAKPQQKSPYEGSYVDKKAQRQVNRQQSHINQRINRESDQAADRAVEQTLDAIFN